jgi:hypothetical protein
MCPREKTCGIRLRGREGGKEGGWVGERERESREAESARQKSRTVPEAGTTVPSVGAEVPRP